MSHPISLFVLILSRVGGFSWPHSFTALFGARSSTLPCSAKVSSLVISWCMEPIRVWNQLKYSQSFQDLKRVLLEFNQRIPLFKDAVKDFYLVTSLLVFFYTCSPKVRWTLNVQDFLVEFRIGRSDSQCYLVYFLLLNKSYTSFEEENFTFLGAYYMVLWMLALRIASFVALKIGTFWRRYVRSRNSTSKVLSSVKNDSRCPNVF